jgi:DNA-binding GntR family transcriptional regulator
MEALSRGAFPGKAVNEYRKVTMPIFSGTKADAAYGELRARILDGTLGPGTLLDQRVLAESYAISTTPIREALRRLEAEQLVVVKAHRVPRVAPLSSQELDHLFAVRLELDPLAAELAASTASPTHRAQVRSILERPISSDADQVARNREFHRSIYQGCGNPVLVQILDSLWTRCDRYRFLLLSPDGLHPQEDKEHRAMVDALDADDAQALRELVRAHIHQSYATLARLAREFMKAHPEAGS